MNASVEVKMLAGLLAYVARALAEHMEAERATELAETLDAIADELRQTA